jgi:hypothetical protein
VFALCTCPTSWSLTPNQLLRTGDAEALFLNNWDWILIMQLYTFLAAVITYVALIAQATQAYPVPARFAPTDLLTRDALDLQFTDLSLRYTQPISSEEVVSRDWKAQAKKHLHIPWKKKDAAHKKLNIMVKTEVMQHYDSLPHQQIQHPHIPKVDGKYHRVQMNGGGPRHRNQQYGIAITTDEPAIAKPMPVWSAKPLPPLPQGELNTMKPLPPIPHGHS